MNASIVVEHNCHMDINDITVIRTKIQWFGEPTLFDSNVERL